MVVPNMEGGHEVKVGKGNPPNQGICEDDDDVIITDTLLLAPTSRVVKPPEPPSIRKLPTSHSPCARLNVKQL
jgi:hypothetical protein